MKWIGYKHHGVVYYFISFCLYLVFLKLIVSLVVDHCRQQGWPTTIYYLHLDSKFKQNYGYLAN